jgi:glutamate racemase
MFDSGVGGLTVFREVAALLPHENLLYFGDTARVPYGTRSPETIIRYSLENTRFLMDQGIKLLVVACNTSSAVALPRLQELDEVTVIGVIEPGARRAVEVTRNGRIGIIGTEGTIKSGAYEHTIRHLDSGITCTSVPCPLFVPLAEEGWVDDEVTYLTVKHYLHPLREAGIDTLVLGCTHYPLLQKAISGQMGEGVGLVNSAKETAKDVKRVLATEGLSREDTDGPHHRVFVTDNGKRFRRVGEYFLGYRLDAVDEILL